MERRQPSGAGRVWARALRVTLFLTTIFPLCSACAKKSPEGGTSSDAAASASTKSSPSAAPAKLDSCLVGAWKSSAATLKVGETSAQGGADVALRIWASGMATVDFSEMKDVHATSSGFGFDFRYSGTGSATLSTPSASTLHSENADFSAMKVSASVRFRGASTVPLLKETPLSELVKMTEGLAAAAGKPAAAAASAVPARAPVRGIDSAPVFASTSYSCAGDTLTIRGEGQHLQWVFARVAR